MQMYYSVLTSSITLLDPLFKKHFILVINGTVKYCNLSITVDFNTFYTFWKHLFSLEEYVPTS